MATRSRPVGVIPFRRKGTAGAKAAWTGRHCFVTAGVGQASRGQTENSGYLPVEAYTTIRTLTGAGIRKKEIPAARAYVLGRGLEGIEETPQQDLDFWEAARSDGTAQPLLCLRCRISEPLHKWLQALVRQHVQQHEISAEGVAAYVLNDPGETLISISAPAQGRTKEPFTLSAIQGSKARELQPFSAEVLRGWEPKRSSLPTWARTRAQAHNPLKSYLKECGVLLISDWALLADSSPTRVREVWMLMKERSTLSEEKVVELHASYLEHYWVAKSRYRKSTGRNSGWLPDQDFLEALDPNRPAKETHRTLRDLASAIRQLLTGRWKWNQSDDLERLSDERQEMATTQLVDQDSRESTSDAGLEAQIDAALHKAMDRLMTDELKKERGRFKASPDRELAWKLYGEGFSQRDIAERCGHLQGWVSKLLDEKRRSGAIATTAAESLIGLEAFAPYRERPEAADQLREYLRNRLIGPEQEGSVARLRPWIRQHLSQP